MTCSPHTRGWTVRRVTTMRQWGLFPAHAGMDRSRGGRGDGGGPVPRTRGDGPEGLVVMGLVLVLFPAHAGMDHVTTHL